MNNIPNAEHPGPVLSVRPVEARDVDALVRYWTTADAAFLAGMGADLSKMPSPEVWRERLSQQLEQDYPEKQSYCTIWEIDGIACGHCNVNEIRFGEQAFMHLHLWQGNDRRHGAGTQLVKLSLPYFFNDLQLQRLMCEPYALNPAPNKTLKRLGFTFLRSYETVPGAICFEQTVNSWMLTREQFEQMR